MEEVVHCSGHWEKRLYMVRCTRMCILLHSIINVYIIT